MPTSGVARRYARAVFEIATERHNVDRWSNDLELIRDLLEDPTLQAFFANPAVSTEQKMRMLDSSLTNVDPSAKNFVNVLVENGRVSAIGASVDAFVVEVNRLRGIAYARLTTARRVSTPQSPESARGL